MIICSKTSQVLCCPAFLVSQGAALAFWPGACASIACTGHLALLTPHILQYTREHHRPTILHVCEIQYEHRQLVAVLLRTLAFYSFSHNLQSLSSTHALPVMLVLLCCTQQFLNILSDLLSLPNHIFCTGQTGAGGCVGVLRDGPLSLPNDAPLPSLPARPAKEESWSQPCSTELHHHWPPCPPAAWCYSISSVSLHLPCLLQLQRGSGVIIVALRHTALLFQLRGLQQRQICFSTMQERRAPRRVQALHPMYVVCPSAQQPLHLLLLQSPVHLAVPRSTGRRSDQLELRPTAEWKVKAIHRAKGPIFSTSYSHADQLCTSQQCIQPMWQGWCCFLTLNSCSNVWVCFCSFTLPNRGLLIQKTIFAPQQLKSTHPPHTC